MAEAGSPAPPLTDLERLRFLVVADLISAILLAGALFYRRREYKRLRTLLREKSLHAVDERFSLEAFTAVLTPVWPIPSSRYRQDTRSSFELRRVFDGVL